jgi:outer membrane protein
MMYVMKRMVALAVVMMVIAWFAPSRTAAQFRLGYVDANVIVQNMPEFKEVESRVAALRQAYEDTLRAMQSNLQEQVSHYKSDVGSMTPEARTDAQTQLNALQTQIAAYQNDRFGANGALAVAQEQLLAPVRKRALDATEKVAQQEKLSAVIDMSALIYVDKKINVNVTYKVLEYLSAQGHN